MIHTCKECGCFRLLDEAHRCNTCAGQCRETTGKVLHRGIVTAGTSIDIQQPDGRFRLFFCNADYDGKTLVVEVREAQ